MSKSHAECFEILGLDKEMQAKANVIDGILGLDGSGSKQQQQRQLLKEQKERKRLLDESVDAKNKKQKQKDRIKFEGGKHPTTQTNFEISNQPQVALVV